MKPTVHFQSSLTQSEQEQVINLLDRAFGDDIFSSNTRQAFFSGYTSNFPNFVLLYSDHDLAGVAITGKRTIQMMQANLEALTIGPLAIEPRYQNLGLSRLLMGGIDDLATDLGVPVAYLVGTPKFYRRYKYYPLLSRSKLVFNPNDFYSGDKVELHPFEERFLPEMIDLFQMNSQLYSCASSRTADDWEWLTRYARNTYYFFQPTLVIANNRVVGYFCTDPREAGRVREAVHAIGNEGTALFLNGIAEYSIRTNLPLVQIMTAAGSPLYKYLKLVGDAVFTETIQSNGGQLMKIMDLDRLVTDVISPAGFSLSIDACGEQVILALSQSKSQPQCNSEVSFDSAYLPGILSGYLASTTMGAKPTQDQSHLDAVLGQSCLKPAFVYQGDNY